MIFGTVVKGSMDTEGLATFRSAPLLGPLVPWPPGSLLRCLLGGGSIVRGGRIIWGISLLAEITYGSLNMTITMVRIGKNNSNTIVDKPLSRLSTRK